MKKIFKTMENRKNVISLYFFIFTLMVLFMCAGKLTAQTSSPKYRILMDIAHKPIFWNDPSNMEGKDKNLVERVKYMTNEIMKNAKSVNADLGYLMEEIKPANLVNCDMLFIHIPSAKYSPSEINAITQYLNNGGSLFLVMDVDYWSTLEQTDVNKLIAPFDLQFGRQIPDTLAGGYTKAGTISKQPLKITYHGGRIVSGGTPFCYTKADHPFGMFKEVKNGGKIIIMGDGMVSLYMTSWKDVKDYQCGEFMHDAFNWLLK